MKKPTAILISGALLCSIAGYFAWCLGPFLLRPNLYLDASISEEGRKAVEEWAETSSYPPALDLTWSGVLWNLSHPRERRVTRSVSVTEEKGSGLWAADGGQLWSFSKVKGKWDASTAKDVGGLQPGVNSDLIHWGAVASRLEALEVEGAVIEVISLGPPTDAWMPPRERALQGFNNSAESLYDYPVLGRARVLEDGERQELVEALARSIREGRNTMRHWKDHGLPTSRADAPPYAIVFTKGEVMLEFLMWFGPGGGIAIGEGMDPPHDSDGKPRYADFRVSPHAKEAVEALIEKHQVERVVPVKKP
ncbi:MAG: hypothetical protein EOP83_11335 [Verrucomicrobiaceae bacterium]|nr:MAG: hypothetical protein EOP83_11335 [Verrucomicrobiaceae bacterium]